VLAAGAGFVWVANGEEQTLVRIDPETNAVVGEPIRIGRGAQAMGIGEGAVWVGHYADGTVSRIDV
jgi:DNA-binding beta-propeller fold protein YncE